MLLLFLKLILQTQKSTIFVIIVRKEMEKDVLMQDRGVVQIDNLLVIFISLVELMETQSAKSM